MIMVILSLGIFTACDEKHTCTFDRKVANDNFLVSRANCLSPSVYYYSCSCGKKGSETFENGEALGHVFLSEATCTKAKKCSRCGLVEHEALGHIYDNTNVCKRCGSIGKKQEDPDSIKSTIFFNDLWAATNSIAGEKIKDSDDVAVSIDLNAIFRVQDKAAVSKNLNVGLRIKLVYDRDAESSAIMLSIYDIKTDTVWFSVYFYLDDPYNLYIDFDGKTIPFGFDTGYNSEWSDIMKDFFTMKIIGTDENVMSIAQLVDIVSETSGDTFDFGDLVDSVVDILNLVTNVNSTEFLAKYENVVNETLGITNFVNDDGTLNLLDALNSPVIKTLLKNVKIIENADGSSSYSLDFTLVDAIQQVIATLIDKENPGIGTALFKNSVFHVSYNVTKDGDMDGFKIVGDFKNLNYYDKKEGKYIYPILELELRDLNVLPISASFDETRKFFNMKEDTDEHVTAEMSVKFESKGINLFPKNINEKLVTANDCRIDGLYEFHIQTNGDLNSNDQLIKMWLERTVDDNAVVFKALYNGSKWIFVFDDSVKTSDGNSIVEELFDMLASYMIIALDAAGERGIIEDEELLKNAIISAFLENVGGDCYSYKEGAKNIVSLDMSSKELLKFASSYIGDTISQIFKFIDAGTEAEPQASDAEERLKKAKYSIRLKDFLVAANDVCTYMSNSYGDGYGILGFVLENKSFMDIVKSWLLLNGQDMPESLWYPRLIGYTQKWYEMFTDIGVFDGYEKNPDGSVKRNALGGAVYKSHKLMTMADTILIWQFVQGSKTYTDYVALMEEGGKTPVSELEFDRKMDTIITLVWNRLFEFEGATHTNWYEILFEDVRSSFIHLTMKEGLHFDISAMIKDGADFRFDILVTTRDDVSREDLLSEYDALSVSEGITDIGSFVINY